MSPISDRYANSGEMNFRVEDKDAAIARALKIAGERLPVQVARTDMDGVRIDFAEGWFNIRKSNTEPYLRLVAECDSAARLEEWTGLLKEVIEG